MDQLFSVLGIADANSAQVGDSFADKLNSIHTVVILLTLAIILQALQWAALSPIECWCPAHFEDSHKAFANKVLNPYFITHLVMIFFMLSYCGFIYLKT